MMASQEFVGLDFPQKFSSTARPDLESCGSFNSIAATKSDRNLPIGGRAASDWGTHHHSRLKKERRGTRCE